jgi:cardiolipin synthase A/B
VVAALPRLVVEGWALQACGPIADASYFPEPRRAGDKAMRVVAGDPGAGKSEMYLALLSALRQARHRAWLTVGYFVPDPPMREALTDAARRGVDVRLSLAGFSDFWAPVYAARANYAALLAAGVRVYERHDALMHAKTAVIDSLWSSIGSTNLDWRSFVYNYEADLLIHDADFARIMEESFRRDLEASLEVTPQAWARRGASQRIKEWLARRFERLL